MIFHPMMSWQHWELPCWERMHTLPFSEQFVRLTITWQLHSQTICQKSLIVFWRGPWVAMNSLLELYPWVTQIISMHWTWMSGWIHMKPLRGKTHWEPAGIDVITGALTISWCDLHASGIIGKDIWISIFALVQSQFCCCHKFIPAHIRQLLQCTLDS